MNKSFKWFFGHYLFVTTILLLVYMLFINLIHLPDMATYAPGVVEMTLITILFPSAFILWGWMVRDFFKHRTNSKQLLWGWFLLLGNVLAALFYFILYWRGRFDNET